MAFEEKDMNGSLFKNDRKEKGTHPDYRGRCMVNGQPLWISAWLKKTRNGDTFLSIGFRQRDEQENKPARGGTVVDHREDDPEMPF